ncbi:MAG: hypothetical protein J0H67_08365 [Rhodospirillales bacterium]|nr:hypothetical protein [Rhodospirillales bacterium]
MLATKYLTSHHLAVARALLAQSRSTNDLSPDAMQGVEETIGATERALADVPGDVPLWPLASLRAPGDLDWLNWQGFIYIGRWEGPELRLRRALLLDRQPGLYAFVVRDQVCHLGRASFTLGRTGYTRPRPKRFPRDRRALHTSIHEALLAGDRVEIWFRRTVAAEMPTVLEAQWIAELKPRWNGVSSAPG